MNFWVSVSFHIGKYRWYQIWSPRAKANILNSNSNVQLVLIISFNITLFTTLTNEPHYWRTPLLCNSHYQTKLLWRNNVNISHSKTAAAVKWRQIIFKTNIFTYSTALLAPQSGACRITPHRNFHPIHTHTHPIHL